MGYPVREYVPGYWYHIYARGQRGEPLFFSPDDRVEYLSLLDRELARRSGNIGSFCLMTNHSHLLLRMEHVSLGEILQSAHSQYAKGFNARRGTRGHVLQGRPGVKVVLDDRYLWSLVGYIHRNPVEAGIRRQVTDFPWSSWYWFEGLDCDWIDLESWVDPPGFEGSERTKQFRAAVDRGDHEWPSGRTYIGRTEEWNDFDRRRQEGRQSQAYREQRGLRSLEDIARETTSDIDLTLTELQGPSRERDISAQRHALMARMYEEGHRQADIARFFNRTPRTVRMAIKKQRKTNP